VDVLVVEHLTKSFGSVRAVDDLSFCVDPGSVFAFLGTNGAGKSTTISCLTTTVKPDAGRILVNGRVVGRDDEVIKSDIGVVFQASVLDPLLTPLENLALRARFYGMANPTNMIDELVALLDLDAFADRRYGLLSGGEKRRTDIARALLHSPSILFLDEPTAGLDPQSRMKVWSTVSNLRETLGLTVFLTTHYMDETENAHDVLVIDKGRQVAVGTPMELRARFASSQLTLRVNYAAKVARYLSFRRRPFSHGVDADQLIVDVESAAQALQILKDTEECLIDFELRHGSMDQVFLRLTDKVDTERTELEKVVMV